MAGYSSIQLKTSGRARPVPERNALTICRFSFAAASCIRTLLSPTAIMESPTSATTLDLPATAGGNGDRGVTFGTSRKIGTPLPRIAAAGAPPAIVELGRDKAFVREHERPELSELAFS